jgi:PII-like signaling protein
MTFILGQWQRLLVYGALLIAICGLLIGYGYHLGMRELWEYQAKQASATVPIVVKQGEVTERVVVKFRDRVTRIKGDTVTVTKEIVRYVPASADPVLPRGWLLLHDSAATGSIPPPAEGADVTATGVAASTALRGVVGNYGTCHATAAQLLALQEWVREQYLVMNLEMLGY